MHILFFSDNFPPEVNAPASRTYEHAKRWVADGAEVTVVTCAPNFPQGRLHEGYSNSWRSVECVEGIRVLRVRSFITSNAGFVPRIADYLSFMFSAVFFCLFEKRPDVVVGTSPQFFAALGAWILGFAKRSPFVFELRDLWPASIVTVGAMERGAAIRMLERVELFLYRRAKMIIPVTQSFKADLIARGVDEDKISVVPNGVDLSLFQPCGRSVGMESEMGVSGKFVVAYLGTHGMAHALENLLDAASLLEDNLNICFLLVGDGARKKTLQTQATSMGLSNVVFHESVAKEQMPSLWSVCDVALVHLKNDPVFATVIPSKIFEAFGMGKPVMIVQPRGEAVHIVESHGAGEHVPPEDPRALADTILRWAGDSEKLETMSRASAEAACHHSRDRLAAEMLSILEGVGDDGRP